MFKVALALSVLLTGFAWPLSQGTRPAHHVGRAAAEQSLLHQMNAGPDGRLTRNVHCSPVGRPRDTHRFDCVLLSTRATKLDASVAVTPDGLQTSWAPLRG